MEPIQDFARLISRLRAQKERKRVAVVCPNDPHTENVITRSLHEGFADFLLVAFRLLMRSICSLGNKTRRPIRCPLMCPNFSCRQMVAMLTPHFSASCRMV